MKIFGIKTTLPKIFRKKLVDIDTKKYITISEEMRPEVKNQLSKWADFFAKWAKDEKVKVKFAGGSGDNFGYGHPKDIYVEIVPKHRKHGLRSFLQINEAKSSVPDLAVLFDHLSTQRERARNIW